MYSQTSTVGLIMFKFMFHALMKPGLRALQTLLVGDTCPSNIQLQSDEKKLAGVSTLTHPLNTEWFTLVFVSCK